VGSAKAVTDQARSRAFRVECAGFAPGIYFSTSAGRAKVAALVAARSAGFKDIGFRDLRVRRAPEFDGRYYCGKQPSTGTLPELFDMA